MIDYNGPVYVPEDRPLVGDADLPVWIFVPAVLAIFMVAWAILLFVIVLIIGSAK